MEESVASGKKYSGAGTKMNLGREAFRGNLFYNQLSDWEIQFINTPKTDIDPTPKGDEIVLAKRFFDKYRMLSREYYK